MYRVARLCGAPIKWKGHHDRHAVFPVILNADATSATLMIMSIVIEFPIFPFLILRVLVHWASFRARCLPAPAACCTVLLSSLHRLDVDTLVLTVNSFLFKTHFFDNPYIDKMAETRGGFGRGRGGAGGRGRRGPRRGGKKDEEKEWYV